MSYALAQAPSLTLPQAGLGFFLYDWVRSATHSARSASQEIYRGIDAVGRIQSEIADKAKTYAPIALAVIGSVASMGTLAPVLLPAGISVTAATIAGAAASIGSTAFSVHATMSEMKEFEKEQEAYIAALERQYATAATAPAADLEAPSGIAPIAQAGTGSSSSSGLVLVAGAVLLFLLSSMRKR